VLSATLRADDVIARVGGDEFAMLLSATDETTVAEVINRIRLRLLADAGEEIRLSRRSHCPEERTPCKDSQTGRRGDVPGQSRTDRRQARRHSLPRDEMEDDACYSL